MSTRTVVTGSGAFLPPHTVSNAALCEAYNVWARGENARNADAIAAGRLPAILESSPEYVERAAGIRERRFVNASGVLDPARLCPDIADRPDEQLSVQAELGKAAALRALEAAGRHGEEIDLVVVGSSALQRPYPAIAIELQRAIGARGFAYDISVGCSSATFAIQAASEAIRGGTARKALVCAPEIPSAYANFRDRESHFILGDGAAAVVLEPLADARKGFEILATRALSSYSSAVRNDCGFINRCDAAHRDDPDKLFHQDGPRVFREIVRLVPGFLRELLSSLELAAGEVSRYWLHQANGRMNEAIASRLVNGEVTTDRFPSLIGELGNTAAAGALLAFDHASADMLPGSIGVLCAFGAGYTVGAQVLRRI